MMDKQAKPLTRKAQAEQDKQSARDYLLALFANDPKPVIKTILRHVSASGMSRDISPIYNGEDITYYVARATGDPINMKSGSRAIRVGGCGMDMGFALVYNLSCVLYGYEDKGGYRLSQAWL